ncbi:plastocyanin/azurin family copper-binding protein [Cellulophaga sp. F20128]|uniref:plastocyanin/azurin family copper-binding protein n=1 Tax=Cellulophaga sp. F20128 TaxID=2926413 RepID=UPI001FF12DFB|nr:plastocyanin/azurin family copper-binding protein [Cellulophaga sp. F20128]MCK0156461.1 plastocyanin/azurin family copper-binding protein [Cellulophaga sp. F20128]
MYHSIKISLVLVFIIFSTLLSAQAPSEMAQKEAVYYEIVDVAIPKDVILEVGGLVLTNEDKLGVSTRRGEVWVIDKPYSDNPIYKRFAHGLHESLGLNFKDNSFYLAQRGELTRLTDTNGDGKANLYKTIYSWPLSGNYHDYSYGPKFTANGDMLVTLNLSWTGHGNSLVKWRGWLLKITPEGEMEPIATGLRSPSGFEINEEGDVFYTENQGDWVGSGRMTHLEKGDFAGNPAGLKWSSDPKSPIKLKQSDIEDDSGLTLYEYSKKLPALKAPAIWFPHTVLGIATSDILYDTTASKFGPFEGQMFIGDQGHSKITRVFMEKINGVYQGAAFPFREGFSSGVLRMIWGSDASMFVGMTSRGWASTGKKQYGLQRLKWTGKMPFEIKTMKALNDGFKLEFTKPVNKKLAADVSSYNLTTFTYNYHSTYGSDIIDKQSAMIHAAQVSEDGLSVTLKIHGLRLGYIHQLEVPGAKATSGELLLHNTGYYTLNEVPGGKLNSPSMTVVSKSDKKVNQPKRTNTMPATWNNKVDQKLAIGTKPGLKYDVEEVTVKRGTKVELTFNNNDDMLHNLVITEKGKAAVDEVGKMALSLGLDGADYNYVPDTDLVLYHTGILQPESSEKIYVQIPDTPGQYWIVCTFPGHSSVMRAKLIVE